MPQGGLLSTVYPEFRVYLQNELSRRCRANPSYSLRRFADHLGIEASVLSKILAKKRAVSRKMFVHLAEKLSLSPELRATLDPFLAREGQTPTSDAYRTIELDRFYLISDWYHYAILELTTVRGFQSDAKWIAKNLNITLAEATAAVERLERLGMLVEKNGRWIDCSGSLTTIGTAPTHAALRSLQKQVLEMGIVTLESVDPAVRDHGSMTMAINSKNLPAAKELIRKFRRDLCDLLQTGQRRDAVMQLSTALYPVTTVPIPRSKK